MRRTRLAESTINETKKRRKGAQNKKNYRVTSIIIVSLAVLGFLAFLFFSSIKPSFTGHTVQENEIESSQILNTEFLQSGDYDLQIQETGKLSSLKLSGSISGFGTANVYLDNLLIYSGEINQEEALQQKEKSSPSQEELLPSETLTKNFANACIETCDLEKLDLQKPFYTLRVELSGNLKLNLQELRYTIIQQQENETISENNATINETTSRSNTTTPETNITIPENTTAENASEIETNITIPENATISNQTNINETSTNTSAPTVPEVPVIPETNITPENITVPEVNTTIPENATIPETNITAGNATTILTEENATIETIQYQAILNQPVKWRKSINPEAEGNMTIELPREAENVVVNKIENQNTKRVSSFSITGGVINSNEKGFFFKLLAFLGLTGRAVDSSEFSQKKEIEVQLEIDDSEAEYEIEYETPAPYAVEQERERGKEVVIVGLETTHYENVSSFTTLNENWGVRETSQVKIYWKENGSYLSIEKIEDTNNNGIYDYIEWLVPHLSNQTFEIIIEISKAEHLNSSRQFISDIYEQVKALDGNWSETIGNREYIRVAFQQNLTNKSDITLFPRTITGNPRIEVYEAGGTSKIAEFSSLVDNQYNKVYLTNLQNSQDSFDLRVVGGSLELDYIVDPSVNPLDTRTVGYEFLNSSGDIVSYANATVVHIWNDKDDYFFDKASGVQFSNHFNTYWTHNIFCGGYKNASNDWVYECNDELPFIWSIASDNSTYVNITGYRDTTVSGKNIRVGIRYHLKLSDESLSVQPSIENTGTSDIVSDVGFAWRTKDIQIFGDARWDRIVVNRTLYWLNNSLSLNFTNLTEPNYKLIDEAFVGLAWNNSLNYILNVQSQPDQYNAPVTLGINAGPLLIGQQKATTLYWRDPVFSEILLPNATTNKAWNGSLNDNSLVIESSTALNAVDYAKINRTDTNAYTAPMAGDAGSDGYVFVNFTLPTANTYSFINVSVTMNVTITSGTMGIALWDFNAETWEKVIAITGTATRTTISLVLSAQNISDYVSGTDLRVMAFDNSNSASTSRIDSILVNVSGSLDTTYPSFTDYWDDNASLVGGGIGHFNVTLQGTNGTVLFEINGANYTATNKSGSTTRFNATYNFTGEGTYTYRWYSWGNGSLNRYNVSMDRSYTVNISYGTLNVTISRPLNNSNFTLLSTNFTINATVTCMGGAGAKCGTVYAWARYNASSANPDTPISNTGGTNPFYIIKTGYANQSDNFLTSQFGSSTPYGITTNGSDFWIVDNTNQWVHHVNRTGGNITDGFSILATGSNDPYDITTNGTDFWIVDVTDRAVYHTDLLGNNLTDGFRIPSGSSLTGITTNGSDFWIIEDTNNWIYHVNRTGGNITNGFSLDNTATTALGITTNGSDFWIVDNLDDFVYHLNSTGGNITDGFKLVGAGGVTPYGITSLPLSYNSGGTPTDFWIPLVTSALYIYHVAESGINPKYSSQTLTVGQSFNVSWQLNMTATSGSYLVDVLFNSSYGNSSVRENDTENRFIGAKSAFGTLNVTISYPLNNSNFSYGDANLTITTNVACMGEAGATCGIISALGRYNASSATPNTPISITEEATPFYMLLGVTNYTNQSNGFSISSTAFNSRLFTTNGSDFWIVDSVDLFIYHVNRTGGNITDGFNTTSFGANNPSSIVTNTSTGTPADFWILDATDRFVYHVNASGYNFTDGFSTVPAAGAAIPGGMTANGSDFWISSTTTTFVYHVNKTGGNITNGFSTVAAGSANYGGMVLDKIPGAPTGFWILDTTDLFVYHVNSTGGNLSDGFKTSLFGSGTPLGIATNPNSTRELWIGDTTDTFIYHLVNTLENPQNRFLDAGQSFNFTWILNVTSLPAASYLLDVLFNSSYGNSNVPDNDTENRQINIRSSYGTLDVNITYPINNSNFAYGNTNLTIIANVTCVGGIGGCGTVYGLARYNFSSAIPDTLINATAGASPFYIYISKGTPVNQSDGFKTNGAGSALPYGITFDTRDNSFWIVDGGVSGDNSVYHFDSSGNNLTDGFSTLVAGTSFAYGITTNGSDFWVTDTNDDFVYHFNSAGVNQSDGFSTLAAGSGSAYGITTNGSDFWVADNNDDFVYHFDSSGNNITDGFSTLDIGANDPVSIVFDPRDNSFWLLDGALGDSFVYHANRTGGNITNGFKITTSGAGNTYGITLNPNDGSFWLSEWVDYFVYHLKGENLQTSPIVLASGQSFLANWTLNVTSLTAKSYFIDVSFNSSYGNAGVLDNNTEDRQVNLIPPPVPDINFTSPTPSNATTTTNTSILINVSITGSNLNQFKWNWNGTNFSWYDNSLILMYNFNNVSVFGEGTKDNITVDLSSYGNNGTISLGRVVGGNYTAGRYGTALSFDGIDDYVNISNSGAFNLYESASRTWSFWIKNNNFKEWGSVIMQVETGGTDYFSIVAHSTTEGSWGPVTNGISLGWDSASGNRIFMHSADNVLTAGTWSHVVVTYNGSEPMVRSRLIIYVDGVNQTSADITNTSNTLTDLVPTTNLIGWSGVAGEQYNGTVDEVRIYNRTLTPQEVYELYASNLYKYDSNKWALYINQSQNATTGLSNGNYTYQAFASDTNNNWNSTEQRTITIGQALDITPPNIAITFPSNNTNTSNTGLDVNYTVDGTAAYCWYSNDSFSKNESLANCGTNITDVTWAEGAHNIRVYANDSAGNTNVTSIKFTVDTIQPAIAITFPSNNTNSSNTGLNINYTGSDANLAYCWYSNDSYSKNTSLSGCANITSVTWAEGKHNVTIWVNDSAGNQNSSSIYFTIDTTKPNIAITFPSNNTNTSNTGLNVNYTVDSTAAYCWYSNDSFSKNESLANCGTNITSVTWAEGKHNVTIWVNDSAGNQNSSSIYFTIDTIKPWINITFPSNNTNTTNSQIDVNYTVSDSVFVSSCWYSNTSGVVNYSLTCGTNITGRTWIEGINNVTIWVNDSAGNQNSSSVYFTIDATSPWISITFPSNNTNTSNTGLNVNYTVDSTAAYCWYSNDSYSKNTSLADCGTNITDVTWAEGNHNIRVYANDSVGNTNVTSIRFTIDTIKPWINITFPSNNTNTSDKGLDINYIASDSGSGIYACWYSNDSYSKNTSLADCGTNITTVTWAEGKHNVTIWVNDTAGNENSSSIYFTIDTIKPWISIKYPSNNTETFDTGLDVNYTVSDANLKFCWYSNDSYSKNESLADCGTNITTVTWTIGQHNVTIWVNDSAGNVNSSSVSFTVYTYGTLDVNITSPANNSNFASADKNLTINATVTCQGGSYTKCGVIYALARYNTSSAIPDTAINTTPGAAPFSYNFSHGTNLTDGFPIDSAGASTPTGIAFDPRDNTFWIVDGGAGGDDAIYHINSIGENMTGSFRNADVTSAEGIAFDSRDNTFWLADYGDKAVYHLNSTGGDIGNGFFTLDAGADSIFGITLDPRDNSFWITDIADDFVYHFNSAGGNMSDGFSIASSGSGDAYGIAFDPRDNSLWITDNLDNFVYHFNSTGGNITDGFPTSVPFASTAVNPIGIAFDTRDNSLWIVDNTDAFVYHFSGKDNLHTSLRSLKGGEEWNMSWTFNVTSLAAESYFIDVFFNSSYGNANVLDNNTVDIKINLLEGLDSISPNIAITFPSNNTNTSNTGLNINYTASDTNLAYCWYSNDSYSKNTSLSGCANITSVTWAEGKHNVTVWVNDTAGNQNSSSVYFTIDTTQPAIAITFPSNNTNTSNTGLDVNYTIDGTAAYCWYSNDSYSKNESLANCGTNITDVTWAEGAHNIRVYANDSAGNTNVTSVRFTIDTTPPAIAITFPSNNTNTTNSQLNVNYTVSDSVFVSNCWYSNDSYSKNESLADCGTNITGVTWTEGAHNIRVYANDSAGNINVTSVRFTIDTIKPAIAITFPSNNTNTTNSQLNINYTVSDSVFVSSCWYSNDSYSKNTSLSGCANITSVTWAEGKHNVTIWVNDSAGNQNSSSIYFTIDTIKPWINITFPSNNTNTTNSQIDVNYTISDSVFVSSCWYSNTSGVVNYSLTCGTNITGRTWIEGINNVTIWVNDSAGNQNSTSVRFNYTAPDTTPPTIAITFPSNNTNTSNTGLNVNYTVDSTAAYCWYSNDSYSKNTSLADCGTNITTVAWSEGKHNITIWVNDTTGNENNASIYFTIDTIAPYFTNFANQSIYSNQTVSYNMTAGDSGTGIGSFAINWTSIFSITKDGNLTTASTLSAGLYEINVSVNDSAGNLNSSILLINVTAAPDTTAPTVHLVSPANNTNSSSLTQAFNCNVTDNAGLSSLELFIFNSNGVRMNPPYYANMSNGFKVSTIIGSSTPYGITTNGSDFWITDDTDNFVYHVNSTGGNMTDGFNTTSLGSAIPYGITTNNSDFWIVDDGDDFVYHVSSTEGNITDGFKTTAAGATSTPRGITTNVTSGTPTDFWFTDSSDDFVYHVNRTGGNITNGFSTAAIGSDLPYSITTNGSDFWILDNTDDFVYHINSTGGNMTDGFPTSAFGSASPQAITTNTSSGTATDFWITDNSDGFVYHLSPGDYLSHLSGLSNSSSWNYTFASEGSYVWNCFGNDSVNINWNAEGNFTILIDTIKPWIDITFPSNNTNTTNTGLDVNYTVSDSVFVSNCWYSNDSYSKNTSLADCGTNITTVTWSEGKHNVTIYVNDSAGNENSSSIYFTIDTKPPYFDFWKNMTNGFKTSTAGAITPNGITSNGSDFWVTDYNDKFVYHFNSTGGNMTDGFSTSVAGANYLTGITTNNSDFWVIDIFTDSVYHFNSTGNITDSFSIAAIGAGGGEGIATNGTDFWITDNSDDFVYHTNKSGYNITDGFSIGNAGADNPYGIAFDSRDNSFWITDGTDYFIYHINSTGGNMSDGFSVSALGLSTPNAMIINGSDSWILDNTDAFAYHFYYAKLRNQTLAAGQSLNYTISAWDDGVDSLTFAINWTTKFVINSASGELTNSSALSGGLYEINISVNDSIGNLNSSILLVNVSAGPDNTPPDINFTSPTPANETTTTNTSILINVSTSDASSHSAWIDWNRSLIGWWSMDSYNATGVYDNSTYENFGNFTGGLSTGNITTGIRGKALQLDGIDDDVIINHTSAFDISEKLTITAWVKLANAGSNSVHQIIVSKNNVSGDGTPESYEFFIRGTAGNIGRLDWYDRINGVTTDANATIEDNNWHFAAVTFNGSTLQYYLDGHPNGTVNGLSSLGTNDVPIIIGSDRFPNRFNGSLDEVMIFSRVLSAGEIIALYNATSGTGIYHNFSDLTVGNYTYKAWAIDEAGNINSTEQRIITISSGVANVAPNITHVYNLTSSLNLNSGPFATSFILNFTVYDPNGDWNDSTAKINVSLANEITRENSSCSRYQSSGSYANYTCNITMWWYDGAGNWNITASISDNASLYGKNDSITMYVAATTGFEISPGNLTWTSLGAGATNQTANNDPLVLNNTGNQPVGDITGNSNISINATNLLGEIDNSYRLFASNFSVSTITGGVCSGAACLECGGGSAANLSKGVYANVTSALLPKGNYTQEDGTGQEQLYFCLRIAGKEIMQQPYSTKGEGLWTIRIFLVAFIPAAKRKRKKKLQDDRLIDAINIIVNELKKKYSLGKKELLQALIDELGDRYSVGEKEIRDIVIGGEREIPISIFSKELGGLEAVSKYMRENLGMHYSDIAKEIGRDERTIWTSYKKAIEKQKEMFEKDEEGMLVPISVFKSKELTIFESVISYLKEKDIKYSEIAKLLNRDQRNIRTIYMRTAGKEKVSVPEGPVSERKKVKTMLQYDKLLDPLNIIADEIKKKYSLSKRELLQSLIDELGEKYKVGERGILDIVIGGEREIPISIFSKELGGLEAVSKYMRENLGMHYSDIAREIGRDERTIWTSYKKAKEKQKERFKEEKEGILIPTAVLKNKELTIFESVISYLKEKVNKYSDIARLLNRDQRNIRTIYMRSLKKIDNSEIKEKN